EKGSGGNRRAGLWGRGRGGGMGGGEPGPSAPLPAPPRPPAARLPALARLESLGLRGVKLGLSAIGGVCERLGRPERKFPSALVGGTNGKGSTAATLSAIAGAHGLRCGLYTSPHLLQGTARVRLEH